LREARSSVGSSSRRPGSECCGAALCLPRSGGSPPAAAGSARPAALSALACSSLRLPWAGRAPAGQVGAVRFGSVSFWASRPVREGRPTRHSNRPGVTCSTC
jgi:hypothetical protein